MRNQVLAWVLGAAGAEFAFTVSELLQEVFEITVPSIITAVLGFAMGIILCVVFVIIQEAKSNKCR